MLKPSKDDPNYEAEMKRHTEDPSSWGPGAPTPSPAVTSQPQPTAQAEDEAEKSGKKGK